MCTFINCEKKKIPGTFKSNIYIDFYYLLPFVSWKQDVQQQSNGLRILMKFPFQSLLEHHELRQLSSHLPPDNYQKNFC